ERLLGGGGRGLTLRRRGGGAFPATVTATPLLGAEGGRQGVVLLVKDLPPWIGPAGDDAASTETQTVEERLGAAFRGIVEATGTDFTRGGRVEGLPPTRAGHAGARLP